MTVIMYIGIKMSSVNDEAICYNAYIRMNYSHLSNFYLNLLVMKHLSSTVCH